MSPLEEMIPDRTCVEEGKKNEEKKKNMCYYNEQTVYVENSREIIPLKSLQLEDELNKSQN